jgi:hypothetical protein
MLATPHSVWEVVAFWRTRRSATRRALRVPPGAFRCELRRVWAILVLSLTFPAPSALRRNFKLNGAVAGATTE